MHEPRCEPRCTAPLPADILSRSASELSHASSAASTPGCEPPLLKLAAKLSRISSSSQKEGIRGGFDARRPCELRRRIPALGSASSRRPATGLPSPAAAKRTAEPRRSSVTASSIAAIDSRRSSLTVRLDHQSISAFHAVSKSPARSLTPWIACTSSTYASTSPRDGGCSKSAAAAS